MKSEQFIFALCCIVLGASARDLRITNNELAGEGEFPYQISMQIYGQHVCGGSLISKRHVLTAGHCVDDIKYGSNCGSKKHSMSDVKISVGSTRIRGGTKIGLQRIAIHPGYVSSSYVENDIAIITLDRPITESAYVRPISLPKLNEPIPANAKLIASGFGASSLVGDVSPVLKKLNMRAVKRESCRRQWSVLHSSHFCATAPGHGVCSGDSGGPLTIDRQVVVGVASAVDPDGCGTQTPDLFTKVSPYIDFIRSEMAKTGTDLYNDNNYPPVDLPNNDKDSNEFEWLPNNDNNWHPNNEHNWHPTTGKNWIPNNEHNWHPTTEKNWIPNNENNWHPTGEHDWQHSNDNDYFNPADIWPDEHDHHWSNSKKNKNDH